MRLFVLLVLVTAVLAAKPKKSRGKKRFDVPKRTFTLQAESLLNIQLVRATTVEIGFSYIQGAEGFLVTAKEWIDGSFEQSVATDVQYLNVQQRSATLRYLIPGREYLIQVQATIGSRKPFGTVAGKVVRTSQMCYVCNGVSENDDCDKPRDLIECPHDKDACSNVVRFDNNKMTISKRCAQFNPSLTKECAGRTNMKDSVCKCMCRSNRCNKLMLPCIDECLDELPMPLKSTLKCSNGRKLGSVCKWECDPGYVLKGLGTSHCRTDRTWSVMSPPQCVYKPGAPTAKPRRTNPVPRLCRPLAPVEGADFSCSAGNKPKSVCSFKCKKGFAQEGGSAIRTCSKFFKWTGTPIVCREVKCPSVAEKPGIVKCSNHSKVGSICDITTPSKLTCQSDGTWMSDDACYALGLYEMKSAGPRCEPMTAPRFGDVSCTNEHEENSICEFTCARGYTLIGKSVRECKNGKWTGRPVTCEFKTCSNLSDLSHIKEVVKCSDGNQIGSVCNVITPSVVACQSDGTWSVPFNQEPRCKECKCP